MSERDAFFESDNLISYYVGPIYIKIVPSLNYIVITNESGFSINLLDLLPIIYDAWEVKEENIIKKSYEVIIIKYDFNIINNYLSCSLIYG